MPKKTPPTVKFRVGISIGGNYKEQTREEIIEVASEDLIDKTPYGREQVLQDYLDHWLREHTQTWIEEV